MRGGAGVPRCPLPAHLDALYHTPEEELFVIRPARFAEDITVLVFELPDGHVAQGLDLFPQGR